MTFSRLRGSRAGDELAHALRRRQRAGQVQANAPEELAVADSSDGTIWNRLSFSNTCSSMKFERGTSG